MDKLNFIKQSNMVLVDNSQGLPLGAIVMLHNKYYWKQDSGIILNSYHQRQIANKVDRLNKKYHRDIFYALHWVLIFILSGVIAYLLIFQ